MNDDKVKCIKVHQYQQPSKWLEYGIYLGILGTFAGAVGTGLVWYTGALAAMLLYWNYLLFGTIKKYVRQTNTMEIMRLLDVLKAAEVNDTEDGTISVQSGLTKGEVDEQEEG